MLFNSYEFVFLFFPITLVGFFVIGRRAVRSAAGFLALASLFFYGWWSLKALPLLLLSICFNYAIGARLATESGNRGRRGKLMLAAALAANLALLGIFKYANFFIGNVNAALASAQHSPLPLLQWALPIGISFYTFTQIAFLVDCWHGKVREQRFVSYVLFVTYFPHLIAGPVLHHAQMMPQFEDAKTYRADYGKISLGLAIFTLGLAKKVLIGDPLGQYADMVFDAGKNGAALTAVPAWLGVLAYTFQIYFDFSGYSDMAIGLSLCLGVDLPLNFNSPYKSRSIVEFWRRWHISLSTFLRDYLYIPLGGNRHGALRRHINLAITMLLGGLWHGASWTFVLWGALHGAALSCHHVWSSCRWSQVLRGRAWDVLSWLLTFVLVCLAWVLFRADSLSAATEVYRAMLGANGFSLRPFAGFEVPYKQSEFYRLLLAAIVISVAAPTAPIVARRLVPSAFPLRLGRTGIVASALLAAATLGWCADRFGRHSPFLYFQF